MKVIESVQVGDEVLATDPVTQETGPRKVTDLIVTDDDKYFSELTISTPRGVEKLTATDEHPFWSPSAGKWVEAATLEPGMTLRTDAGDTVTLRSNRFFHQHARTYNLTVENLHSYYVLAGATPVLVHNMGGVPSRLPTSFVRDEAGRAGYRAGAPHPGR
ncbi:polymorphic toxin-type HINT domain-containing protein [Streptomyces sp. CA-179760]|uniref:polymorphic toxin-type HINT domain-containing protein n=1 Tax=Streptomyces sp. CA-179760 TaxID=3240054 RepID=UPI003D912F12